MSELVPSYNPSSIPGKIGTIFICERGEDPSSKAGRSGPAYLATDVLNPELVGLLEREIEPTVTAKVDGTAVKAKNGALYARQDRDPKRPDKQMPEGWDPVSADPAEKVGFRPLNGSSDKWILDTMKDGGVRLIILDKNDGQTRLTYAYTVPRDGTYELLGPKVQSNLHGLELHALMPHGLIEITNFPDLRSSTALSDIREWFNTDPIGRAIEGVVLHFETGQMFKLHRHHLSLVWNAKQKVTPLFDLSF